MRPIKKLKFMKSRAVRGASAEVAKELTAFKMLRDRLEAGRKRGRRAER